MKNFIKKIVYKQIISRIYNPFLSLNLKPMPLELKETDKCLVIAPHPDDESIGCGGIMKLHPNNFEVLCLTHGDKQDLRYNELKNAMNFAGITNFSVLNFKDKHVINYQSEFNKTDLSSYDYIFIPYIFDQHKDHKAVSFLLNNKLEKKNHKSSLKIVFYEVWSTINMPQYYVDISSVIEDKKKMINFHQSQTASKDYAEKIIGLNSYRGLLKSIDAAEAYSALSVNDFYTIVSKLIYDL